MDPDIEDPKPATAGQAVPGVVSLDQLAAEAASIEGAAAAPGAPAGPAPDAFGVAVEQTAAELLGAFQMARMMVAPMFGWWPEFGQVWGDSTLQNMANGWAQVMQRHGWTAGGLMGEFGPYIAAAGATLPPSFVTYQAIKARRAELESAPHERPQQTAH